MDKRSDFQYASKHLEKKEKPAKRKYTKQVEEVETVKVRLLKDMNVNVIGKVTGKRYSWQGGGSVVNVDILDKDKLLEKRGNPVSCCDDVVNQPYFELVE